VKTLSKQEVKNILSSRFTDDKFTSLAQLPSPFELKDMQKGVDRIAKAIKNKEKILLVGDYDVDGTTSRVIIEEFFEHIGAEISSITPNRFRDGYGLSVSLIQGTDAKVIITVDNGITSYEAGEYCQENNIDLVITDHHIASELPKAYCIINPKQPKCTFPFAHICGAQIAWYLVAGLKNKLNIDFNMSSLLDILVLAIVADVMPLVSMNRVLTQKGLEVFATSKRPAMLAIKETLNRDIITAQDIGFGIAPKINAAGRMEDAILAIDFLKSQNIEQARKSYAYLNELNAERKQIQEDMFKIACDLYEANNLDDDVIVVASEHFNAGVIGIVASSLVQKYNKASLVGAIDIDTGMAKMSGRSCGNVDLFALLNKSCESVSSFGGHREAVGLNIGVDKIDVFSKKINAVFNESFSYENIDNTFGILDITDIDYELLDIIQSYEPYGHQNEQPTFLIKNIHIISANKIGKDKKTLKLIIDSPQGEIPAIAFNYTQDINKLEEADVDIYASINKNTFRGIDELQLMVSSIEL